MAIDTSLHAELQRKAKDHLWLHFSSMGAYRDNEIPIIERGEGPYLFDTHGKRYLDMLSGLFTVQIGYSYGEELGQAALEQMRQLPYYTNWTFAHPPAAELAARLADLAPPEHQPRVLRLRRLRGRRVGLEARAPVPRGQRPADAAQGHLAQGRLPRHHHGRALDHGHHVDPHAVRAAHRRRPPRRQHEPLPLQVLRGGRRVLARVRRRGRRDDRAGGARDRRHGDHGARPELGRHVHAAPGVPPPRARDLRRLRRPAGRRRGDLRLRPARRVVRLPALRLRARPDHVREGPDERVRVARRAADLRPRGRAVRRGRRVLPARHHVRRPSDGDRDRRAPTST